MIDLHKLYGGTYRVTNFQNVQPRIECQIGYIISQRRGDTLLAVVPMRGRKAAEQHMQLVRHGKQVNDCSSGELWLQFDPRDFQDIAKILKPYPADDAIARPNTVEQATIAEPPKP